MWVDPGSVSVKFLTSQKIKILYDITDPSFNKEALGAASSAASEAQNCAQEYSMQSPAPAAAVSAVHAQRV